MGHDKHYVLKFGDFELEMPHKTLSRDGNRLKLGGRAASLLAVLAEADGALVTTDELLSRVWPDETIDDSAIRVHLSALRKVLGLSEDGAHLIVNETGRGYRLALTAIRTDRSSSGSPIAEDTVSINLPLRIDVIIGRDQIITSLSEELISRRLITVAGPGGIGKTTVGVAAGRATAKKIGASAFFVDFSPIGNDGIVAPTIAVALDLKGATSDLIGTLISSFRGQSILLVFDNCEHVLGEVARIAESLLSALPDIMILCTSREPLGAQGEWIHRLAPLEFPMTDTDNNNIAEAIRGFSSIQLFCERAKSVRNDFALNSDNYRVVVNICRQLDGMPLAIEFAAARMNVMTASAISEGLKKRFDLLTKGRRTAIPRHKTLRATLDWSYDLLGENARQVLNRLSVFRSTFDVSDARAVADGGNISADAVFDELFDLVEKSMLIPHLSNGEMHYRLLETTRQYALEKLIASGEAKAVRQKHAQHITALFSEVKDVWEGKVSRVRIDAKIGYLDDVRAAIDWALGGDGDITLGQGVLAASSPIWFYLSLPGEFITHTRRFLGAVNYDGGCDRSFELLAAYGHALWHKQGPGHEMRNAFEKALAIAHRINDDTLVLRAIWGIWAELILSGKYDESRVVANDFIARLCPNLGAGIHAGGLHMQALSSHFCGDHTAALKYIEPVMKDERSPDRNNAQFDRKVGVTSLLIRLKWYSGEPQEALKMARNCAQYALDLDHSLSICYGLSFGCIPVAIANGEYDLAANWISELRRQARDKDLDHWGYFADGYQAAIEGHCNFPHASSKMQRDMFEVALSHRRAKAN